MGGGVKRVGKCITEPRSLPSTHMIKGSHAQPRARPMARQRASQGQANGQPGPSPGPAKARSRASQGQAKDHGPRSRDKRPRTEDKGSRTEDQGPRNEVKDQGPCSAANEHSRVAADSYARLCLQSKSDSLRLRVAAPTSSLEHPKGPHYLKLPLRRAMTWLL